ncbi:MAG: hypothetical protein WD557_07850 [Dehalococcoidia bacterium]
MLIERPPGDPSDWTIEGWAEQKAPQLMFPWVGRAHRVRNPWELRTVDALDRIGTLDDQLAVVLRDVDTFVLSHDRRFPGRLASVDITLDPNPAHVDWIRFAAQTMAAIGYDAVPVLMASNVKADLVEHARDKGVLVLWWEPLRHHVEWYGPKPGYVFPSDTLVL